ncbi:MAG: DUF4350 domain-containing protein [Planctomycetaceae bacterium]
MSRVLPCRSDAGWLLAVALLVLLQFWWLPGDRGTPDDTFSTSIAGKRGFYEVLTALSHQGLLPPVRRESDSMLPADAGTLVIVGPERYPDVHEQQSLSDFVARGGTLLFAPHWDAPDVTLSSLGIRLTAAPIKRDAFSDQAQHDSVSGSSLVNAPVPFRTSATLHVTRADAQVLVTSPVGETQAAAWKHGSGMIVVSASADVFSNSAMLNDVQAELAVRLLETAARPQTSAPEATRPPIVISEYLNTSDAWRGTAVLLSPGLRSGTLQLLTIAVLIGWLGFHRFGPPVQDVEMQRRSLTESAMAVGDLQLRTGSGDEAVRQYLEYFRTQIQRRFGHSVRLTSAADIAARTGLEVSDVAERIRFAMELAESDTGTPATTANAVKAIRQLAQILHPASPSS